MYCLFRSSHSGRRSPRRLCALLLVGCQGLMAEVSLVDPADGWLDASDFLDTAYGFMPVIMPITEPAVGYGVAGALVFIDRDREADKQSFTRPNIALIGGMRTENGSEGLFGVHLGTWNDGRLRTTVALADVDVNLEFFGLGGQSGSGNGLDYTIGATGGVVGGSYRLNDAGWWTGLRYAQANTDVSFDPSASKLELLQPNDRNLDLGALVPSLTLDRRNNFFTPTSGWYLDLSMPIFREAWGSDRDFETLTFQAMHFRPLSDSLFLSIRAAFKDSSDGTPFYMRPYVDLRGVQALGYQGEEAAETEVELRWQFHPRFSLVGFGGAGIARSDLERIDSEETITAGGVGFRYLIARRHGLQMGVDVAQGPDEAAIYIIFGSAWMRE